MKLHHYGITSPLNNWLRNLLTHRTLQTICDSVSSPPKQVISEVPQGTVLGPLLFLLYVNNLASDLECPTRLLNFADDCLLHVAVNTAADMDELHSDLNKFRSMAMHRFGRWKLTQVNVLLCAYPSRKIHQLEYTFCNNILTYVEMHSYLGVTVDSNLRWNNHLHEISSKAT